MKAEEALEILNKVCAGVAMNRADHLRVMQAVAVLQQAITKGAGGTPAPQAATVLGNPLDKALNELSNKKGA